MAHLYPHGLLLSILLMVMTECRDVLPVIASQEDDVALPCFNSTVMDSKSCIRVKWIKCASDTSQTKVILAIPKTSKIQDAERVKWGADGNGQMSLFLTKLQKSDEGVYSCEVWRGWDSILVKNISLKVKECKALQAVRAAPGTPVNLTCPVDMTLGQQGPQNISWLMRKGGNSLSVHSERAEITGTSLSIQSVNYRDSGWYSCKYVIGFTQRCFDINLLVQALTTSEIVLETREEGNSSAFIAVVASVFTVIAIIAALIGLLIYSRHKAQGVAQPTKNLPAGNHEGSFDGSAIVQFIPSDDPTYQQINSLYQGLNQDDGLYTFHY